MNQNISLKSLRPLLIKRTKSLAYHASFIVVIVVLCAYLFVVWRISKLATAEPTDDAAAAQAVIPKVDKKAIDQIQQLEQNSPEVQSLFNSARNNPFSE